MIYRSQLWLSSVVCTMAIKVKHTCALIESVHICSSLSVEAACLIVQQTRQSMYTFYCLGNILNLCTEIFLSFLCLKKMS